MKSKLLLSASIVSLTVGLSSGAHANPPNPNNSPTLTNDIYSSISGDFVNNSTLGRVGPSKDEIGLYITDDAEVTGDIINNGNIYGTQTGVRVNESGILDGSIVNKGLISASTKSDDSAYGVVMNGRGVLSQDVQNSGHIVAKADDSESGTDPELEVDATGIFQRVSGAGNLSNSGSNSGSITVSAHSLANATSGYASASAYATGVTQQITNEEVGSSGSASNSFNNSDGSIDVTSWAQAQGDSGSVDAEASATAGGIGINQYIYASSDVLDSYKGTASVNNNNGNIDVYSHATATGGDNAGEYASATAQVDGTGVRQHVEVPGTASVSLTNNDGSITVTSKAYANGGDGLITDGYSYYGSGNANALATASAVGADQFAQSYDGSASTKFTNNDGTISVGASAQAHAGNDASAYDASARAYSTAYGVHQGIGADGTGTATIENTGEVTVSSFASAEGGENFYFNGESGTGTARAFASAQAYGLVQSVEAGGAGLATIANSGDIHVDASAKAISYSQNEATAFASAEGVVQVVDSGTSATAKLQNDGTIYAGAKATATVHNETGGAGYASAQAAGVWQSVSDTPANVPLAATVDNTDSIVAVATGEAHGYFAGVGTDTDNQLDVNTGGFQYILPGNGAFGVFQFASDGTTADLTVTNSGEISATGYGYAEGDYGAKVDVAAIGVAQVIGADINGGTDFFSVGTGTALVNNSSDGQIYGYAVAIAEGGATANALASAAGVVQVVAGYNDAYATVVNDGQISAEAYAWEGSGGSGDAVARVAGVEQVAEATIPLSAWASVENTGDIHASAEAYATGNYTAPAYRHAEASAAGVGQTVIGPGEVTANVTNDGTIEAIAYAEAGYGYGSHYGTNGHNEADAIAIGVDQAAVVTSSLFEGTTASLTVTNSSNGWIEAGAHASAEYAATGATADATAVGVRQIFDVGTGSHNVASVVNDGFIVAQASATVHIYVSASNSQASANAVGIDQGRANGAIGGGNDFNFSVDNSGAIVANAQAYAYSAYAHAIGILAGDDLTQPGYTQKDVSLHLTQTNEAEGYVSATASAQGVVAYASAVGIADRAGAIDGTIENDGEINASAFATAEYSGAAHAVGIEVMADANDATVTNKGTIIAYAAGDRSLDATGILFKPYTTAGTPDFIPDSTAPSYAKIVNDGGTIFAGIGSSDNGLDRTYRTGVDDSNLFYVGVTRGNAINIASITNDYQHVEIDLKGTKQAGNIYGDILLGDGGNDPSIVVSDGTTRFNGEIKPNAAFSGTAPYAGSGTLDIKDGGTFKLVLNQDPSTPSEFRYYGLTNADQARVYVDTLNVESGGILSIGLSTDDTTGHYGQVFAANITNDSGEIAGDLKGHFIPGVYATNFHATYDSVVNNTSIDHNTWSFNDVYSNTPLITVTEQVRDGHIDLVANRDESNSFENSADTKNQKSVGRSIDSFYSGLGDPDFENPDYTPGDDSGNFNDLIAAIFALDGQKAFDDKMDELSAEPFAQQLNQSLTSFDSLQSLLLDRLTNGGAGGSGGPLGYADEKVASNSPASNAIATTASLPPQPKASFWARGIGDWQSQSDPSSSALAYSGSQAGGYIGGDINVGPSTVIGAAAGLTTSSMNFDNGDHINSTGFQAAGYGRWDSSAWYVRGFGGYGQYSNNSSRYITILNTVQKAEGTYNTKVAAGYAELGFKGWEGASGGLVPFAGLGAAWGSNDAFTEHGSSGDLDVASASGMRLTSSVGAELVARTTIQGTPFEGILRAAWQHVWTGGAQSVNAAFNEAPDGGIGFTSTSTLAADLAAVTASGTWNFMPMTSVTVQYDGKFGSGFLDTSFSGTVKQQF